VAMSAASSSSTSAFSASSASALQTIITCCFCQNPPADWIRLLWQTPSHGLLQTAGDFSSMLTSPIRAWKAQPQVHQRLPAQHRWGSRCLRCSNCKPHLSCWYTGLLTLKPRRSSVTSASESSSAHTSRP
jgi:hypothetical protein